MEPFYKLPESVKVSEIPALIKKLEKFQQLQEMAMYHAYHHIAITLGESLTLDQLKLYIENDRGGKSLLSAIKHSKKLYGNLPMIDILYEESENHPLAWNEYSAEDRALIQNLMLLIDQLDIEWL